VKYIVGAYATAPSTVAWDENLETQYFKALADINYIKGIEHPFTGKLHNVNDNWFLQNISPDWEFVFTSIPGVMNQLANNPHFGIASDEESGRTQAIAFYQKARDAIQQLNRHLGRQAVTHIKIHTAPRKTIGTSSSIRSLNHSLLTMQAWDWHGAKLVIEHCDAYIQNQPSEKGFLTIEEELQALTTINECIVDDVNKIGISINWGRSAIEARSAAGPIKHVKLAYESNLLTGIIFSGTSDQDTPYGKWKDSPMPPSQSFDIPNYAEGSLLTFENIKTTLQQCKPNQLDFIGGKISIMPNHASVNERISYIVGLLTQVNNAII
jgi:hypothetical protein